MSQRTESSRTETSSNMSGMPSEGVRALISFLLFFHMFAVVVALSSGGARRAQLPSRLRDVPGLMNYLQLVYLDAPFTYLLTTGDPMEFDHYFEVELRSSPTESTFVTLPSEESRLGINRLRYRQLATNAVFPVENEIDQTISLLPEALARGVLLDQDMFQDGAEMHAIRLKRHVIPNVERIGSPEGRRELPPEMEFPTIYLANFGVVDGQFVFVKSDNPSPGSGLQGPAPAVSAPPPRAQ
jgi:hypothetical protein